MASPFLKEYSAPQDDRTIWISSAYRPPQPGDWTDPSAYDTKYYQSIRLILSQITQLFDEAASPSEEEKDKRIKELRDEFLEMNEAALQDTRALTPLFWNEILDLIKETTVQELRERLVDLMKDTFKMEKKSDNYSFPGVYHTMFPVVKETIAQIKGDDRTILKLIELLTLGEFAPDQMGIMTIFKDLFSEYKANDPIAAACILGIRRLMRITYENDPFVLPLVTFFEETFDKESENLGCCTRWATASLLCRRSTKWMPSAVMEVLSVAEKTEEFMAKWGTLPNPMLRLLVNMGPYWTDKDTVTIETIDWRDHTLKAAMAMVIYHRDEIADLILDQLQRTGNVHTLHTLLGILFFNEKVEREWTVKDLQALQRKSLTRLIDDNFAMLWKNLEIIEDQKENPLVFFELPSSLDKMKEFIAYEPTAWQPSNRYQAIDDFERAVDWRNLKISGSSATLFPCLVYSMLSTIDRKTRDRTFDDIGEAIFDNSTDTEAAVHVIPYLIRLLQMRCEGLEPDILELLRVLLKTGTATFSLLLGELNVRKNEIINDALEKGYDTYVEMLSHPNPTVQALACYLVAAFPAKATHELILGIRGLYLCAPQCELKASAMLCVFMLINDKECFEPEREELLQYCNQYLQLEQRKVPSLKEQCAAILLANEKEINMDALPYELSLYLKEKRPKPHTHEYQFMTWTSALILISRHLKSRMEKDPNFSQRWKESPDWSFEQLMKEWFDDMPQPLLNAIFDAHADQEGLKLQDTLFPQDSFHYFPWEDFYYFGLVGELMSYLKEKATKYLLDMARTIEIELTTRQRFMYLRGYLRIVAGNFGDRRIQVREGEEEEYPTRLAPPPTQELMEGLALLIRDDAFWEGECLESTRKMIGGIYRAAFLPTRERFSEYVNQQLATLAEQANKSE